MPVAPTLSEVPYEQADPSQSSSRDSAPNPTRSIGSLISPEDLSASLLAATLRTESPIETVAAPLPPLQEFMTMFRVRDDVEDGMKMYYQEKSQKKDLPTLIAESQGCKVELSDQGAVSFNNVNEPHPFSARFP